VHKVKTIKAANGRNLPAFCRSEIKILNCCGIKNALTRTPYGMRGSAKPGIMDTHYHLWMIMKLLAIQKE